MAIASSSRASTKVVSSTDERSSSKKAKKDRNDSKFQRSSSKDRKRESRKGKGITSEDEEENTSRADKFHWKDVWKKKKIRGPKESAFKYLYPTITIPIPPALLHDPHRAADELMDTLLMRYVPQLSGVLLSHRNVSFLHECAKIDSDGAYSIAPAGLTCLAWAPEIGMRLEGQIQLSTPSHVSLLVHGIFNVSITSAHLPATTDITKSTKDVVYQWKEFENEYEQVKMEMDSVDGNDLSHGDSGEKSTGYWIDSESGEKLGGSDGKVTFTVIGMTVVNHMLSLFGSLLRKPFSIAAPTYVPALVTTSAKAEKQRRVHFQEETQSRTISFPDDAENEEDSGDSDDDELPTLNIFNKPEIVGEDSDKNIKKRSKIGPKREGELSGSESEGESKREKKKRKI